MSSFKVDMSLYWAAKVDKLAHGSYLSAKAWNSRVLLEWLNDSALRAAENDLPQAGDTRLKLVRTCATGKCGID